MEKIIGTEKGKVLQVTSEVVSEITLQDLKGQEAFLEGEITHHQATLSDLQSKLTVLKGRIGKFNA